VLALQQRGLAIPGDVSLVGFDDNEWMQMANPAITAVRQPVEALARSAWGRIVARLRGDPSPPVHVRLEGSFHLRSSTVKPAGRGPARRRG